MSKRPMRYSPFPLHSMNWVLGAGCWMLCASTVHAQSTNGVYSLTQEAVTTAGDRLGSGGPVIVQGACGLFASGAASNGVYRMTGGLGDLRPAAAPVVTKTVAIQGTVNDPAATISVNGIAATVAGTTFTANLVLILGPNVVTATATDASGNAASKSMTVYLDVPDTQKTARFTTMVHGSIGDAAAAVSVNGVAATITSGAFAASVPLTSGLNMLTATATDSASNVTTRAIHVFVPLPTRPPAMPTVGTVGDPVPVVTTQSSVTVGGTKTAGTTVWINGAQIAATSDATTWTATVSLSEGDNVLVVVAKDAAGASSAEAHATVILDTLPPVITIAASNKTNLNPFTLKGSVDDSLTRVEVQGLQATRTGKDFEVIVPLVLGAHPFTVTATSPNNYTATKPITITLGTIPSMQTWSPFDGTKLYPGTNAGLQITAVDAEGDPIQYQVLLDGVPLGNWSAAVPAWTPSTAQIGPHTVTVSARDDYGGADQKNVDVLVIRSPIAHP